jgi:nucleoid-associated protein YgaU
MKNGPGKLVVAAAALAVVWIVTYWLLPTRPTPPPITFDSLPISEATQPAPEQQSPKPDPSPAPSPESKVTEAQSKKKSPCANLPPAPTPVFDPVTPPEFTKHTLLKGETIWSLAEVYFGDRNLGMVIARANPQVDPQKLRPGNTLLIPKDPGNIQGTPIGEKPVPPIPEIVEYVVHSGDTLTAIALQFYGKVSLWTRIRDANPNQINQDGTNIRPGMKLLIPPPPSEPNP